MARPSHALDGRGRPAEPDRQGQDDLIDNWEIPIAIGGQKGQVTGTLTWVPEDNGGLPIGAIFGFAALLIVLSVAGVHRAPSPLRGG